MAAEIIDFHGHYFPPSLVAAAPSGVSPAMAASWALLTDLDRQLELSASAGTDVRVVTAPYGSLTTTATVPVADLPARVNDALAAEVGRHGGRLVALATVDAFRGDAGAEEARRAVDELGFPGIVVDVTQGELLLAHPRARPTLAFAAERRIPVFAHPVTPGDLAPRFADAGRPGVLLARATESVLATLQLLADRVLESLSELTLIITGIGAAALIHAPFLDPAGMEGSVSELRQRLCIDTMGFDPATVRFAVDVVGAERVLVGSDWPIMWRDASRDRVLTLIDSVHVTDAEAELIAGGTARRLLGLPAAAPRPAERDTPTRQRSQV